MTKYNSYKEILDLCNAGHHNKDIQGWETLNEFNNSSKNKDFNAKVYKQGNRIVISIAGTNMDSKNDINNDRAIFLNHIPSQYGDVERLYNQVKTKYPNAKIESTGYSLGGTLSNLLSHRTGIKSTAIAPIGSQHIVNKHKDYFKYDGSNITTYGRKGDFLFNSNLNRQSGKINILPDLSKNERGKDLPIAENHYLHNFNYKQFYQAQPYQPPVQKQQIQYTPIQSQNTYHPNIPSGIPTRGIGRTSIPIKGAPTGGATQIQNFNRIFTPDEIGKMSSSEFTQNEKAIMYQIQNGLIQNQPQNNYSGYRNSANGSSQIFSREDIGAMSTNEYTQNEKAISAQLNSIGIPTNGELHNASLTGGGTEYVRPYMRSDGTQVKGYYRSK